MVGSGRGLLMRVDPIDTNQFGRSGSLWTEPVVRRAVEAHHCRGVLAMSQGCPGRQAATEGSRGALLA